MVRSMLHLVATRGTTRAKGGARVTTPARGRAGAGGEAPDAPRARVGHGDAAGVQAALLGRLGGRVRALRAERGLTARALALAAGLSPRFVADLEAGRGNIAVGRLEGVARALGTTAARLLAPAPSSAPSAGEGAEDDALARLARLLEGRTPAEQERALRAVEEALGRRRRAAVALLGLRGAGKSTLGAQAADRLGVAFVELDERIEAAAGLSLAELFAIHGEGYYRRLEAQCLAALLDAGAPAVVATGGGLVTNDDAFRLARGRCTTVWLRASPHDHMTRVLAQGDRRPVAGRQDAMTELEALLAAREPLYRQADLTVDTSALGARALDALLRGLARHGWGTG